MPPFTDMIVDVAKIKNGLPLTITHTPIKKPSARLPASPMSTLLGYALCQRYPIREPASAKLMTAQLAPFGKCGTSRYSAILTCPSTK